MTSGWPKSAVAPSVAFVIAFAVMFLLGWILREPAPLRQIPLNDSTAPSHQAAAPGSSQLVITVTFNPKRPDLGPSAVVEKLSIRGSNEPKNIDPLKFETNRLTYPLQDDHPVTVCITLKPPWEVIESKPMDPQFKELATWCTKDKDPVKVPIQFDLGGGE